MDATSGFIIAVALIASSPDDGPPPATWPLIRAARPALLAIALDAEVIDPREASNLLTDDCPGDILTIQRRLAIYATTPHVGEVARFPETKLLNEFLAINRAYYAELVARRAVDVWHRDVIDDAIIECDGLYMIYDAARDARCEYYYVTTRREALATLRRLIGDESFYLGRLPPVIPLRHLPQASPVRRP